MKKQLLAFLLLLPSLAFGQTTERARSMKKIGLFLLLLLAPFGALSQTASTYYTLPTIAALKALTTRPSVVEILDSNPGIFNWSTSACSAADDIFQVTPTAGPTGCYVRVGTPYALGKSATLNGVWTTDGSGISTPSASLPSGIVAPNITAGTTNVLSGHNNGLAYQDGSGKFNVTTSLANAVAVTSGGSVPSWATTLPNGLAMGTPASLTLTNATGLPSASLLTPSALNITSTASTTARSLATRFANPANVLDFGAVADFVYFAGNVSIASSSHNLTVTGATFTSGDVGKHILVPGAGAAGVALSTTISAFTDVTHVTLTTAASTTLSAVNQYTYYGTDNTTAFQAAAATGAPVYVPYASIGKYYYVSDAIALTNQQPIFGDGVTASVIFVDSGFNLSALGVVRLGTSETGATFANLGITAYQPDTTDSTKLIQYPPLIYAQGAGGFKIVGARLSACMVCIDARGNTGHSFLVRVEGSFFTSMLQEDGAQDMVYISQVNAWPYFLTANQQTIMAAQATAFDFGRVDSFEMSQIQTVGLYRSGYFHVGSDGASYPHGTLNSWYTDSAGGIVQSAGDITAAGLSGGMSNTSDFLYSLNGGALNTGPITAFSNNVLTNPVINIQSTQTSSAGSISGTTMTLGGSITGVWEIGQVVGGSGVAANTKIVANAYTNPGTYTGKGGAGTYGVNNSQTVASKVLSGTATMTSGGSVVGGIAPIVFQASSVWGKLNNHDAWMVYSDGLGSQIVNIGAFSVQRDANVAYSKPSIYVNSGSAYIASLSSTPLGTGTGTLYQGNSGAYSALGIVNANGWAVTVPSGQPNGSTITVNGTSCTLGNSCSPTATASSITSGTTTATGFTNGHVVGVSGGTTTDFGVSGTGTTVALTTSPTFTGTVAGPTFNATTQYNVNGSKAIDISADYMQFWSGTQNGITIGNSAAANYYNNGDHIFRSANTATTFAHINSSGLTSSVPVVLPGYAVASLPASPGTGALAYVTDQLTACPALSGTFTGGGSVKCRAWYNGTAWVQD